MYDSLPSLGKLFPLLGKVCLRREPSWALETFEDTAEGAGFGGRGSRGAGAPFPPSSVVPTSPRASPYLSTWIDVPRSPGFFGQLSKLGIVCFLFWRRRTERRRRRRVFVCRTTGRRRERRLVIVRRTTGRRRERRLVIVFRRRAVGRQRSWLVIAVWLGQRWSWLVFVAQKNDGLGLLRPVGGWGY